MALQAQSPQVGKIAFAAALDDGHNVMAIPEGFAAAKPPVSKSLHAGNSSEPFDAMKFRYAVHPANRTNAFVTLENSAAKMAGIGAQFPLFNAPLGAKREAARRNL